MNRFRYFNRASSYCPAYSMCNTCTSVCRPCAAYEKTKRKTETKNTFVDL